MWRGRPARERNNLGRDARATLYFRRAFSVVELLVVIGIITLILALGLPAFNEMAVQQRMSKTQQLLTSALTRTQVVAVSENTFAAVRLMPAHWRVHEDESSVESVVGRQFLTTYVYRQSTRPDPDSPVAIHFEERFEEIADGPAHLLSPGTWVAPIETLDDTTIVPGYGGILGDQVLNGTIDNFELNADARYSPGEAFLDADDFLIVFDKNGLVNSLRRQPWLINGYDPREDFQREWAGPRYTSGLNAGKVEPQYRYQRFNFTGVIVYQREAFLALGNPGASAYQINARRDLLNEIGMKYYVDRNAGGLIEGGGL